MANTDYWNDVEHNRNFKTSVMYRELRGTKEQVEWRKMMYNNNARPRDKLTLCAMYLA